MSDSHFPLARFESWVATRSSNGSISLVLACATLLSSAFLLFSVEPMFAKMVLPRLGGSPSVWAVSLCFFQAALLAGYAYAHLLNRWLAPRQAATVHLAALALAWLSLPIGLPATLSAPTADGATLWLLGILAMGVGVPFVVVSASAPLLQSWFARSGHPHGANPYFLYGASNVGSLLALLAYPLAIEPLLGLSMQAALWGAGFLVLAVLIALSAVSMLANPAPEAVAQSAASDVGAITWSDRGLWLALSFVPSGLLVAFTTYLATDIASAPFLWVMPLSVFLVTFILVFRADPPRIFSNLSDWQPKLVAFASLGLIQLSGFGWVLGCSFGLLAFFATAMVCHRTLYERRPGAAHITEFYLWMSLGGVLGGVFAAIVAPLVFNTIFEYPLLLVLGLALRPGILAVGYDRAVWWRPAKMVAIAVAVFTVAALGVAAGVLPHGNTLRTLGVVVPAGIIILSGTMPVRQLTMAVVMLTALATLPYGMAVGSTQRSFFGVMRVTLSEDGQHRLLMHGVTLHGAERIKTAAGVPVSAAVPATYYHPDGPMARGLGVAREALSQSKTDGLSKRGLSVGVVGLGTGAMACHAQATDTWDFFEIDPLVAAIARDPRDFTYLSRCRPDAPIKIGDARLTVANEPAGKYDYLLVDAFSSDAIPVHLLTAEALRLYLTRVADDGVLAMHVSNRYLDIAPIVARTLVGLPFAGAVHVVAPASGEGGYDSLASEVILVAKTPAMFERIKAMPYARPLIAKPGAGWTDDYTTILYAILSRYIG